MAHVDRILQNDDYKRGLDPFISKNQSVTFTRALIMGRYGMLQCANNFSNGYGSKDCKSCCVIDNENHRLNHCPLWATVNLYHKSTKVDFDDIYADDYEKCLEAGLSQR